MFRGRRARRVSESSSSRVTEDGHLSGHMGKATADSESDSPVPHRRAWSVGEGILGCHSHEELEEDVTPAVGGHGKDFNSVDQRGGKLDAMGEWGGDGVESDRRNHRTGKVRWIDDSEGGRKDLKYADDQFQSDIEDHSESQYRDQAILWPEQSVHSNVLPELDWEEDDSKSFLAESQGTQYERERIGGAMGTLERPRIPSASHAGADEARHGPLGMLNFLWGLSGVGGEGQREARKDMTESESGSHLGTGKDRDSGNMAVSPGSAGTGSGTGGMSSSGALARLQVLVDQGIPTTGGCESQTTSISVPKDPSSDRIAALASGLEVFRLFAQVGAGVESVAALEVVLGLMRRPRAAHSVLLPAR